MVNKLSQQLDDTLNNLKKGLFAEYNTKGFWEGRLSSSALATATAVFALYAADAEKHADMITSGMEWLASDVNPDGGWGDTTRSKSNISTTTLCWAALNAADKNNHHAQIICGARSWVADAAGGMDTELLAGAIDENYSDDKTFSVPILTMCALAGLPGGSQPELWPWIKILPFELALLPRPLFRWLPLSVVSYALPALISMGLVNVGKSNAVKPAVRFIRLLARRKAIKVLARIQPGNGGFLEAVPLTSFVVMSLVGAGLRNDPVVEKGVEFIADSVRPDGSWAIDTNLSTWLTSLTVNALAEASDAEQGIGQDERQKTLEWLLDQQYLTRHPYTDARPGGWAWTDLPGGVPDADDTAGALIAIHHLTTEKKDCVRAAERGLKWLLNLQNKDGGIPTFCKGWMDMPFDRSAPDLTAHAVKAMQTWSGQVRPSFKERLDKAIARSMNYLSNTQAEDGSWIPLWFGNEKHHHATNPLYGTSKVIQGICSMADSEALMKKSSEWLIKNQNDDGGWGAAKGIESSVEETALAVDALARLLTGRQARGDKEGDMLNAANAGASWLIERTRHGTEVQSSPIGLYFARLWYFEELYPYIYSISALQRLKRVRSDVLLT